MYFIWGEDQYFIDFHEKEIISNIGVNPIIFDQESSYDNILAEINTVSMFDKRKLIILRNIQILTQKDVSEADELFNAIQHVGELVTIVFVLNTKKLILSNNLIKFLFEKSKVIEVKKPKEKDLVNLIKNMVEKKKGTITNKASLQLSLMLPNNLLLINNEINKLLLETNNINTEVLLTSVANYNISTIFDLSNAIVSGNAFDIVDSYYNQLKNEIDPIMIIGQLASNYELAYLIHLYKKAKYSLFEISQKTSIHIYRIKKISNILNNQFLYSPNTLLLKLAQLDNKIKTGQIKKEQALDMFILNIIKSNVIK